LEALFASPDFYIQNTTPATLVGRACQGLNPPKTILDLCAAPGGKSLAVHDLFPSAKLFANDVSPAKLRLLKANFEKYAVEATLTEGKGEDYSTDQLFDLIILDVPCSNSGVLNKRPEARWRLTKKALEDLKVTQLALIERAAKLLAPEATLLYITCSLLKQENEQLMEEACKKFGLKKAGYQECILPADGVWDGGFACTLITQQHPVAAKIVF
jgi:16S rRNA (cytosine967-C5)-methyltransferase